MEREAEEGRREAEAARRELQEAEERQRGLAASPLHGVGLEPTMVGLLPFPGEEDDEEDDPLGATSGLPTDGSPSPTAARPRRSARACARWRRAAGSCRSS
ncbi:unnamed protein product [Prorocentrum cordatum]|uniref:Uncharacterized protein n=1 Tax=Prorocentrum cordatum TaxID=2364126 RepID=A0ABN9Q677_9DINO|nr:unnamed protein product [Polarella glacialis]